MVVKFQKNGNFDHNVEGTISLVIIYTLRDGVTIYYLKFAPFQSKLHIPPPLLFGFITIRGASTHIGHTCPS